MKRAIRDHLRDFVAIIALILLAAGIGGYILSQQRLRFPLVQAKPFEVKVELPNAQAVQPGQGQTVRVAGVQVGDIGKVELEEGIAVVTLQLKPKYDKLIREDATVLLRTKTGLKDMFIEVDPGDGRPLPEGGRVQVANSEQDVDQDEVLSVLDRDTRDYLKLLISGAGKGLEGRGSDLRETFARLGPLHRDLDRFSRGVARRRGNLRRLIHNYGVLTEALGKSDGDIVRLVRASNDTLGAFAAADQDISRAVARLPGTLRQTKNTLAKVDPFADRLGSSLESLRPAFRRLDEANRQVLPLVTEATPTLRDRIRPFAREAQPFTRNLGRASRPLSRGNPGLATSFGELNRFFNIGAYNPGGSEGLTGDINRDRARNEGYLYWLGWASQVTVSLFNTGDAQGPFRRTSISNINCNTFTSNFSEPLPDELKPLVDTTVKLLADAKVCAP
jgi:phospholipid/cholesterol/gamma-HCH transport system substrate-binding protein